VTEEMEMMEAIAEPTPEAPETLPEEPVQQQGTAITITFSFGDNQEWFIFEQSNETANEELNFA